MRKLLTSILTSALLISIVAVPVYAEEKKETTATAYEVFPGHDGYREEKVTIPFSEFDKSGCYYSPETGLVMSEEYLEQEYGLDSKTSIYFELFCKDSITGEYNPYAYDGLYHTENNVTKNSYKFEDNFYTDRMYFLPGDYVIHVYTRDNAFDFEYYFTAPEDSYFRIFDGSAENIYTSWNEYSAEEKERALTSSSLPSIYGVEGLSNALWNEFFYQTVPEKDYEDIGHFTNMAVDQKNTKGSSSIFFYAKEPYMTSDTSYTILCKELVDTRVLNHIGNESVLRNTFSHKVPESSLMAGGSDFEKICAGFGLDPSTTLFVDKGEVYNLNPADCDKYDSLVICTAWHSEEGFNYLRYIPYCFMKTGDYYVYDLVFSPKMDGYTHDNGDRFVACGSVNMMEHHIIRNVELYNKLAKNYNDKAYYLFGDPSNPIETITEIFNVEDEKADEEVSAEENAEGQIEEISEEDNSEMRETNEVLEEENVLDEESEEDSDQMSDNTETSLSKVFKTVKIILIIALIAAGGIAVIIFVKRK